MTASKRRFDLESSRKLIELESQHPRNMVVNEDNLITHHGFRPIVSCSPIDLPIASMIMALFLLEGVADNTNETVQSEVLSSFFNMTKGDSVSWLLSMTSHE
jgi:hypothetical protein